MVPHDASHGRSGQALEFASILSHLSVQADDPTLRAVVNAVREGVDGDDVAQLATLLARSGPVLSPFGSAGCDIASTGGPSSLATLLCPLYLVANGLVVPKLGVPGRPAGGVDVLATIPGYRVDLDPGDVQQSLRRCGYAHFSAGTFAPLDAALFSLRQRVGAQQIPDLAIASLLAKKLAVGLSRVGVEVRAAPHGNFGDTVDHASANARRLVDIARRIGIEAVCFVSDASQPYQPYVGRGEALVAVYEILTGTAGEWLAEHDRACRSMASYMAARNPGSPDASHAAAMAVMSSNLEAQGSSMDAWARRVTAVRQAPRRSIAATSDGWISFDLARLRTALVRTQRRSSDPDAIGVTLRVRPGSFVERGQVVLDLREAKPDPAVENEVSEAIVFATDAPPDSQANRTIA